MASCQASLSSYLHGIPTEFNHATGGSRPLLDLFLQCRHWVAPHDRPRWLCFDLHLLTEHVPDSCLCGRFRSGLDTTQAMQCENARLLYLFRGNVCDALQKIRASLLSSTSSAAACWREKETNEQKIRSVVG